MEEKINREKWELLDKKYTYEYMMVRYRNRRMRYDPYTNTVHTSLKDMLRSTMMFQNFSWVTSKEDFWNSPPYEIWIRGLTKSKYKDFTIDMSLFTDKKIIYNQKNGDMVLHVWDYYLSPKLERIPFKSHK